MIEIDAQQVIDTLAAAGFEAKKIRLATGTRGRVWGVEVSRDGRRLGVIKTWMSWCDRRRVPNLGF